MPIDPLDIEFQFNKAYIISIRYISYRPRSTKEVKDHLLRKKTDPDIISGVLDLLVSQNFLDDEAFTKWWIEHRQEGRARSKSIIKMELRGKGIQESLIEIHLENAHDDLQTAKDYFQKKRKRFQQYEGDEYFKKASSFLARRGFSWDVIREVLKEN